MMKKIKGIYDGNCIQLLEPISLKPDTVVEVLIPEQDEEVKEREFLEYLKKEGLLKDVKIIKQEEEEPFEPVPIRGAPLSQTIIEDRR